MSPGPPDKEHMIAMYNLQLLQTAFRPRPPTSKIQIATYYKKAGSQDNSLNSLNLDMRPHLHKELEMCGQNQGRWYSEVPSYVWMLLLRVTLRLLQGRPKMAERKTQDML